MCNAPNCDRDAILERDGYSVCRKHYNQLWRHGSFQNGPQPRAKKPLAVRMATHTVVMPNGCWLWTGAKTRNGYGHIKIDGKLVLAHRASYEMHFGPIPNDSVIDHICRVRDCTNPNHLEAVSFQENVLRGVSFAAENAKKTHCANGHEYTEDNTIIRRGGGRDCRICQREAGKRYYRKSTYGA